MGLEACGCDIVWLARAIEGILDRTVDRAVLRGSITAHQLEGPSVKYQVRRTVVARMNCQCLQAENQ